MALCVAVATAWLQSYHREAHISGLTRAGRWTLRSIDGRLTLFVPPRATSRAASAQAQAWAASALAGDYDWHLNCAIGGGFFHPEPDRPVGISWWGASVPFRAQATDGRAAPLLAALESPQTFLRAHILLAVIYGTDQRVAFEGQPALRDDGVVRSLPATIDGLRVVLRHPQGRIIPHGMFAYYTASVEVDAAQLPFIRDQWHRRLDVRIASVPDWLLVVATALLPLIGLARITRRGSLRRRGLCIACGYDLRASEGRCPECATPIPANVRATT